MKRIIRLTESDLVRVVRRIIKEQDKNPLAFITDPNNMDYAGFNKSSKPDSKLPTPYNIGGVQLLGGCSTSKSGTINKISNNEVEIEIDGVPSKNYEEACENRTKAFEPKSLNYKDLPYLYKREFNGVDVKNDEIKKRPDPIYKFKFSLDNNEISLKSAKVTYTDKNNQKITDDLLNSSNRLFFKHSNGQPRKVRDENGKLDIYFAPLSFYKMFGLED